MEKFSIQGYVTTVLDYFRLANKWISDKAPWNLTEEFAKEKGIYVRTILEALFILTHFIYPILPETAEKILSYFHRTPQKFKDLSWNNLVVGEPLEQCPILFARIYETRFDSKNKEGENQQNDQNNQSKKRKKERR